MTQETGSKPDVTIPQDKAPHEDIANETRSGDEDKIVIPHGRKLSQSQKVLLEFGQELIKESVTQAVEFHKTMLGLTATFATLMASSFAILTLGSGDQSLNSFQRSLLIVPVLLMLISAVCFALGYYPRHVKFSPNDLTEIEDVRKKLLGSRGFWAVCGVLLFILSIITLLIGIVSCNVG